MQTCSLCNAVSPDEATTCSHCGADLSMYSVRQQMLKRFRENPRVIAIRINVAHDACSACAELTGTYAKDDVPVLPHAGCSHEGGCRCTYEPVLGDVFP